MVLGAVIGSGRGWSALSDKVAVVAIVECVCQQARLAAFGQVPAIVGQVVASLETEAGRIKAGRSEIVGGPPMPFEIEEFQLPIQEKARVAAQVQRTDTSIGGRAVRIEALARLPRDHVDRASAGVGSAKRRRRALHEVDPVNSVRRLPVHVQHAPLDAVSADAGAAVQKNQWLLRVDHLNLRLRAAPRRPTSSDDSGLLSEDVASAVGSGVEQLAARD